jgi:hypothetical protein
MESLHYEQPPPTPVIDPTPSINDHGITVFVINEESRYAIKI